MLVAVKPRKGVAWANLKATPPAAQATMPPATVSFNVFLFIVIPPLGVCTARKPAVAGSAMFAEGAAVCCRSTVGRHLALPQSDGDSGTAVPSPTPRRSV